MSYFWLSHAAWGFLSLYQCTVGPRLNHLSTPRSPLTKTGRKKLILTLLVFPLTP